MAHMMTSALSLRMCRGLRLFGSMKYTTCFLDGEHGPAIRGQAQETSNLDMSGVPKMKAPFWYPKLGAAIYKF